MDTSRERSPSLERPGGATQAPGAGPPEIRLLSVSKRFGSLWANRGISVEIHRGEIHAIVGENGAGKTTLLKVLCGHLKPDEGKVLLDGMGVRFRSPRQAGEAGLGMVGQQPSIFPQLTALENICLGHPPNLLRSLGLRRARRTVEALCSRFGFDLPLDLTADALALAHRQQIEILRVLYRGARVLVLDEPTSLLAPPEVERLLDLLGTLRSQGHSIVFVSHRLAEVFRIADRISILAGGRCLGSFDAAALTEEAVAALIAGGTRGDSSASEGLPDQARPGPLPGKRRLLVRLENVHVPGSGHEPPLRGLSVEIREGESLGIGGVVGNGQRTLARVVAGLAKPTEGRVVLAGEVVTEDSVAQRRARGVRWLPENLADEALLPDGSLLENCLLGRQRDKRFHRHGWLRRRSIARWAEALLREGSVRFGSLSHPARSLSGGNVQKMALCRTLEGAPALLVLEQPMRGLDFNARQWLGERLHELRRGGTALLVISNDLDELLALCDRVGILFRGALMGMQDSTEARRETLVQWMLGAP